VQRLFYGPESELAASRPAIDLGTRELAVLWPLVALMLIMGLAPSFWLPVIETGVRPPQAQGSTVLPASALPQSTFANQPQGEGQR